jgi:transcriptional regulator GlxA family with amidase domain
VRPGDGHGQPALTKAGQVPVVRLGLVVCSAGIAAGIDRSRHVVGRRPGREAAEKTARQVEYPWRP